MSDAFGSSTQQNILTGGDGAKLYGWYAENTSGTTVFDVNNASGSGAANCLQMTFPSIVYTATTLPLIYRKLTGDFDVNTKIQAYMPWAQGGLIASDELVNPGHQNFVRIFMDGAENLYWDNVTNDATTNSGSGASGNYLRINRTGGVFTIYSSTNGSSWTQQAQWTRNDLSSTIYVGFLGWGTSGHAGVYNQFAYFNGTYTDAGGSITASATVTLPLPTVDASSLSAGTIGATAALPHLTSSGSDSQTGNFCDNTLPVFQLDGEFAAVGDVEFDIPVFQTDGGTTSSNPCDGKITMSMVQTAGLIITGTGARGNIVMPVFSVDSLTAPAANIQLPVFSSDSKGAAGNIARSGIVLPIILPKGTVITSAFISPDMALPMFSLDNSFETGKIGRATLSMPVFSGLTAQGAAGNTADAAITVSMFSGMTRGYGQYLGKAVNKLPLILIGGVIVSADFMSMDVPLGSAQTPPKTIVINTKTKAVTYYDNFAFNSYGRHDSFTHLGANSSGIYAIEGDTDNGQPIACMMQTGVNDFGEPNLKQILNAYFHAQADELPVTFKATADGGTERTYWTSPKPSGSKRTSRVTMSRGDIGRHWEFKVEGTAPLEINSIQAAVTALRRIR